MVSPQMQEMNDWRIALLFAQAPISAVRTSPLSLMEWVAERGSHVGFKAIRQHDSASALSQFKDQPF
jgi:hypothetical protein